MKPARIGLLLLILLPLSALWAETMDTEINNEPALVKENSSLHASQADWTFSGIAANENGERYYYFFQIQKHETRFHGIASIINATDKSVLIYEESSTLIEEPELTHWQVGNLFLRFNAISNSWVFGLKQKDQKGFNFKVDMFGAATQMPSRELQPGIQFLVTQTGRLNGHLHINEDNKEQFVTAKKAWFRQIWRNKPSVFKQPLHMLLCDFDDGSALYAVNFLRANTLNKTIAGWRSEDKKRPVFFAKPIFMNENSDNQWSLQIPVPKMTLILSNLLDKLNVTHQFVSGPITALQPGFCALNRDDGNDTFGELPLNNLPALG